MRKFIHIFVLTLVIVSTFALTPSRHVVLAAPLYDTPVPTNACNGSGFMRSLNLPQTLSRNDDLFFGPIDLGFTLNFFGTFYNQVYISNNGYITFAEGSGEYTPEGLSGLAIRTIAPFYADVDTRPVGSPNSVQYGFVTVDGHPAFAVHYNNVGYYEEHLDKVDDFMVIVMDRSDRGTGDFDFEFNYNTIQWETGDASGGSSAAIGSSDGYPGINDYQAPGSLVNGAFLDSNLTTGAIHTSLNSPNCGQWIFSVLGGVPPGTVISFSDVPITYWAWQYIESLYNAQVTGGCILNPLQYCPDTSVTRAQMAVFLEKGKAFPSSFTPPNVAPTFTDTVGHWAEDWIEALRNDGITGGCAPGLYCPDDPVTRAQMAVFLLKAKHGPSYVPPNATGVFTDVPVGYWADKWIEQLAAEGITGGCAPGLYCPEDPVTRAQMAVFLTATFNLP
jgi:hypothetical protein